MKILMCLDGYFPPDIRVEKEAKALSEAGHKVFILCRFKEDCLEEEEYSYASVLRLIPLNSFLMRVIKLLFMIIFGIDPIWTRYISRVIPEKKIDAVHVHDLPLVNTVSKITVKKNLPLVVDLHENYPELIGLRRYTTFRSKLAGCFLNEKRWKNFQKSWLKKADRVITVVNEIGERLVKEYGVQEEKITIVMNTEDLDSFRSIPVNKDIIQRYDPFFTILYVGGFGIHRGIQTLISSMPGIKKVIPEAFLLIVGTGNNENELKQLTHDKGLDDSIEFTGWQPFTSVPSYIAASDVCLVPYINSIQTNNSSPHKLFQYMALGKPVIVSSMKSLSRIIGETGAGLIFKAENPDSLTEQVIRLYRDKDLAMKTGQAGITAVKTKYNMQAEGKKLVELYESLRKW